MLRLFSFLLVSSICWSQSIQIEEGKIHDTLWIDANKKESIALYLPKKKMGNGKRPIIFIFAHLLIGGPSSVATRLTMTRVSLLLFHLAVILCASLAASLHANENGKPLKVYILAGQSNMSGYGNLRTLDYMKRDPVSVPILNEILDEKGRPRQLPSVRSAYRKLY